MNKLTRLLLGLLFCCAALQAAAQATIGRIIVAVDRVAHARGSHEGEREAEQQGGEPGGAEGRSHQRSRRDLSRVLTMGLSMYSIIVRLPVWMLASAAMPGEMPRCSEASPR